MTTRRRPRVRIAARNETPKTTASEDRSEARARTGASRSRGNDGGPERAGVEA
jgi:hypothetical protein